MELSDDLRGSGPLDVRICRTRTYDRKVFTSEDEDDDFDDDEMFKEDEDDEGEAGEDADDKGSEDEGSSAEEEDDDDEDSADLPCLSLSSVSLITRVRREEGSFFSLLPAEIRLNILSFLGPSQLAKIRLVSHQWRELAEDDRLWRRQHQDRLGGPLVLKYSKNPIRKQVERNRKKEMLLLRQEQRQRKKEWAEKRKMWARREKARHKGKEKEEKELRKEKRKDEDREERELVVKGFIVSVVDHEKRRASAEQIVPPSASSDTEAEAEEAANAMHNTEVAIKYAIREGVLNEDEIVIEHTVKRVKDMAREIKDEIKTLDEDLQVLGIQEKQGAASDARWVEGYWAFGRYIKKIAHAAQLKETKKHDAMKKHTESRPPIMVTRTAASPPVAPPPMPYSPYSPPTPTAVSPRVVAGENMRMRQFKALEEKEKKKDSKKEKKEKKEKKKEKRARSLSDTRKAQEKKSADKIDVYGKLKRQRSRTTDDIEPAALEARESHRAAAQQDDPRKRSALGRVSASPAQGVHRQRSHTIDYEDHLERQKKAEEAEKKERKAQAKLEKEKEKAKRKETDFWAFWGSISRSVQAWIMMTAASFGHRKFLERLYMKLKADKTVGKLLVPIFHQLLHAACQQGQPETAEFLLHVRLEFQTDRRIAHSPAFKHMEHQMQVARWDAFRTASKWGHTKLIEILLSHGYQPDERAVRGAIVGGQLEILKLLISYGADIKPLHMKRAIYYRNRDIVAHLLDLFPHLPQAEPYLLKIAVSTRANFRQTERLRNRTIPKFVDFGIIDLLLAHGADINDNSDVHYAPSPLHIAAQQGNPSLCEYLLEKGADMHGIFSCPPYAVSNPLLHKTRGLVLTLTPFEVAVYNGRERAVEYFLAKAASSTHPLTEISKLFCKPEPRKQPKGANMFRVDLAYLREAMDGAAAEAAKVVSPRDKPKLTTILHQPEELDQVPNIRNIFKIFRAYRVNFKEIESHVSAYLPALSPLHHAAKSDNLAGILSMLLEMGLNREKRDKKGRTPLLKAARFCSVENIQVLVKHQALVDAIDCEGNSAFHHLVTALPSMPTFLAASAPMGTSQPPRSPTKIRAALGHSLPLGSSPPSAPPSSSSSSSSSSPGGSTTASQDPNPVKVMNAIQFLLESGGDINMINNLDETCLDLLARKSKKYCPGKNDVVLFLKAHGAKSGKELVHSVKSKSKLRGLLGL